MDKKEESDKIYKIIVKLSLAISFTAFIAWGYMICFHHPFTKYKEYRQELKNSKSSLWDLQMADNTKVVNDIIECWKTKGLTGTAEKAVKYDSNFFAPFISILMLLSLSFVMNGKKLRKLLKKNKFQRKWLWFLVLPLLFLIFDLAENCVQLSLIRSDSAVSHYMVSCQNLWTLLKHFSLIITVSFMFSSGFWAIGKNSSQPTSCKEVIDKEKEEIFGDGDKNLDKSIFGIALSGGGIRSATLNLGIMEVFNKIGLLAKAHYLSTVSGGGYLGSFIHAKLFRESNDYSKLFKYDDLTHLKRHGNYLTPGSGFELWFYRLRLVSAYIFNTLLSLVWLLFLLLTVLLSLRFVFTNLILLWIAAVGLICFVICSFIRFVILEKKKSYKSTDGIAFIGVVIFLLLLAYIIRSIDPQIPVLLENSLQSISGLHYSPSLLLMLLVSLLIFIVAGFLLSPNLTSMHGYYRDSLARAYKAHKENGRLKLSDLKKRNSKGPRKAPYPLINTCLNITGEKGGTNGDKTKAGKVKKGKQFSDYFLLSPLYCGSQHTRYVDTSTSNYDTLGLDAAMTASGAALNPGMGTGTIGFLSFFMTLLNIRTGHWSLNPEKTPFYFRFPFWPYYLLSELFGSTHSKRWRINISDGGHIENLAVYELLRRRCKLIIAVDASADPAYNFGDLKNLVIRARNELGIEIKFKKDPEEIIKPKQSHGFSRNHYVLADLIELPTKEEKEKEKEKETNESTFGLLVYIKASMIAPTTRQNGKNRTGKNSTDKDKPDSYYYKTYHPSFPHESTIDQFYDEPQWEAYHELGKYMAWAIIGEHFSGYTQAKEKQEQSNMLTTIKVDLENRNIDAIKDYLEKAWAKKHSKKSSDEQTQSKTPGEVKK